MKRFISKTALASCVMFSVIMAWFLVMGYLFAGPSYGLNLTASLMAASLGMAVLQTLWFSEAVFKRLAYPARIAGFGACGLPVIAGPQRSSSPTCSSSPPRRRPMPSTTRKPPEATTKPSRATAARTRIRKPLSAGRDLPLPPTTPQRLRLPSRPAT